MFGSEILDVAIGMAMMFLVISLMCSAVNEFVEGLLKNRARDLERGIRELLSDPSATGLVKQLYGHPLISGLYRGSYDPATAANLPSYIPSRTFAIALMDLLQPGAMNAPSGSSATVASTTAGAFPAPLASLGRGLLQQFRQTIGTLADSPIKAAMFSLIDSAGDDPVVARQNIEDWFNASMDRVSGWYKRRTQFILIATGFVVAVAINADCISFARFLSTSKAARDLVVSRATKSASSLPPTTAGGAPESGNTSPPTPSDLIASIAWLNREGELPVGWRLPPSQGAGVAVQRAMAEYEIDPKRIPENVGEWAIKLLGFVLTALAVSFGAPFWFDVLNKFMVVRSTIKPDEKSKPEASKS